jgi:tight adherence protein B
VSEPTLLLLAGTGALAIFVFVLVVVLPGGDSRLQSRLRHLDDRTAGDLQTQTPDGSPRQHLANLRQGLQAMVGSRFERTGRGGRLGDRLDRADLHFRPGEWIMVSAAVSVVVGLIGLLRFGSVIGLVLGAVVGYVGVQVFLRYRESKRAKLFGAQLSPMILQLSGAMKAGYTFAQALDLVAKNMPAPMGQELSRVTREAQLGLPMNDALNRMVRRNESEDLRLMLIAVQIQAQVGGNLAQVLDTIEFTVRERIRIKGEIKTLTGQARASGWVLIALPFGMTGILAMIAPTYFDPMFTSTLGEILLGVAFFMVLCGYAVIRKIVNIRV